MSGHTFGTRIMPGDRLPVSPALPPGIHWRILGGRTAMYVKTSTQILQTIFDPNIRRIELKIITNETKVLDSTDLS